MADTEGTIIGANGDVIRCRAGNAATYQLAANPGIFGAGPVDVGELDAPGLLAGALNGRSRFAPRPLRWSVAVQAATTQDLLDAIDRLVAATSPVTPGTNDSRECQLIVTRPNGRSRQLSAKYSSGLDSVELATVNATAVKVDLIFRAADPHWVDVEANEAYVVFPVTDSGVEATPFDDPIEFDAVGIPFDGYQSTETEGTSLAVLVNSGKAAAWPVWSIQGSATSVEVVNRATGTVWRWQGTLGQTETLTVVSNDRHPSLRIGDADRWGDLVVGSALFPLVPGDNEIVFTVAGADTNTRMSCQWQDRWLTP